MTTTAVEIHGTCDERFAGVREEFARGFAERDELGASVAVVLDGELVVDLWGGWADAARTRPWERDTIVVVHSVTKGMVSMCAHMLAARGLLDFDARVVEYWPEFGKAGKEPITVRQVISHQAGLPVIDAPLPPSARYDWQVMTRALEEQPPIWEPGTKHGYHTGTWGHLVGEVIRRITGRSPGTVLREELCGPWGLDFHLGFGPELDPRVADLVPPSPGTQPPVEAPPSPLRQRAFGVAVPQPGERLDIRASRAAESPSGGGHGSARAIALAFGGMARGGELNGVRLIPEERIPLMYEEQVAGMDEVLGMPSRYSLGFWLTSGDLARHRGPRAFNHPGVGGAIGLADPDLKLGFGYAMNRTGAAPRRLAIERAVYAALEG